MYLLILILTLALASDLSTGRIPNRLFVSGMMISQIWVIYSRSVETALHSFLLGIMLMLFLLPLFMIGCLGAGDIKLIMLFPNFWDISECMKIIALAFVLAAVIGTIKMIANGSLSYRLKNLLIYVKSVVNQKKLIVYDGSLNSGTYRLYSNQIHFSLPVFISAMLFIGRG